MINTKRIFFLKRCVGLVLLFASFHGMAQEDAQGKIITRTIFPIVSIPDFSSESGNFSRGLSDIVFTTFYVAESDGIMCGLYEPDLDKLKTWEVPQGHQIIKKREHHEKTEIRNPYRITNCIGGFP